MVDSLKKQAVNAASWSFIQQFGARFFQFLLSIVLARLLTPEDFGLIAMLAIFLNISFVISNGGLGIALIQKKDLTPKDCSTVFILNAVLGFSVALLFYFVSPYIALYYEKPELVILARILSVGIFVDSLHVVQDAINTRELRFKSIAIAEMIAQILAGIVAIYLAIIGKGVLALVWSTLVTIILRTSILWFISTWRPNFDFGIDNARRMFNFSSKIVLERLSESIFQDIYWVVVGRYFSVNTLGYYSRADSCQRVMSWSICNVVTKVALSVFSTLQYEKEKLKQYVRMAMKITGLFSFSILPGIIAVSDNLILVVLGEKWLPSIYYLRWLAFAGMFFPLLSINIAVLTATGKSTLLLFLGWCKRLMIIVFVIIGCLHGIEWLLYSLVIINIIMLFIYSVFVENIIKYSFANQFFDLMPTLIMGGIMSLLVFLIGRLDISQVIELQIQIITGIITCLLYCIIFRLSEYKIIQNHIVDFLTNLLQYKKK